MGLFRNRYYSPTGSLSRLAWKRFVRNRLSLAALSYIMLMLLLSILGYLVAPDPTPHCNRQIIEIALEKPGFSVNLLKVRKNEELSVDGLFHRVLYGRKDLYRYIPFQGITLHHGDIIIEGYTGKDSLAGPESLYSLADVLYPVDMGSIRSVDNHQLRFATLDGQSITRDIASMEQEVIDIQLVTKRFLLGTDQFGRDLLSRLMLGTRVSLSVGFIAVFISLVVGITIGSLGGFFRGWTDQVIMWLINVVWSIPTLLLVIALAFALGKGYWQVFVAVGLTMWVEVARVTRGQIISIREKEYVEAARALGFRNLRIITRHILPNITGPLTVISAANFASAILIEAGLSFLGIGVQPPMPSWGSMIRENYPYIILDYAYLAVLPGLAIMLMVLSFMICGNGLRDALDVKVTDKPAF